jgi:uncharacterized phiE125 gp8 family phage protein
VALSLITGPTMEPVSLAEAKAHCRITEADEDGVIAGYILAARNHVETETRRALLTQTWELTLDAWPASIVLPRPPAISITSISYVDAQGATQTLAADQYRLVKQDTGEWAIIPAYQVTWPTLRVDASVVTVRYACGYGTLPGSIPEELRQAMLLLVEHWFRNRGPVAIGTIANNLDRTVDSLLFPHRVFY